MPQAQNRRGLFPEGSGPNKLTELPVAASQTIAPGDCVALDGSGDVIIATAGSALLAGVCSETVSSPAAGTRIKIWADPGTIFIATADADSSTAQAGAEVDLSGTTGNHQLDMDASATDVFKLLMPIRNDDTSVVDARWRVKINKHAFGQID